MSTAAPRGVVLYRAILQSHRRSLPPQLKKLGDEYVRAEFRLHKKVEKPDVLGKFFAEWENYLTTIRAQKGRFGRDLDPRNVQSMSEAQRGKLNELKDAAKKSAQE